MSKKEMRKLWYGITLNWCVNSFNFNFKLTGHSYILGCGLKNYEANAERTLRVNRRRSSWRNVEVHPSHSGHSGRVLIFMGCVPCGVGRSGARVFPPEKTYPYLCALLLSCWDLRPTILYTPGNVYSSEAKLYIARNTDCGPAAVSSVVTFLFVSFGVCE